MAGWIPRTGELSIAFIATSHCDIKSMTAEEFRQGATRKLTMEPLLVINAKAKDIAGFPVRRALPAIERRMIGPFIDLDVL